MKWQHNYKSKYIEYHATVKVAIYDIISNLLIVDSYELSRF